MNSNSRTPRIISILFWKVQRPLANLNIENDFEQFCPRLMSPLVTVWKNEKFCHWKKISSNHLFSNFFSKTNAFTKVLRKKCEREFLQFPHFESALWKLWNFTVTVFSQIFRQINVLLKNFRRKIICLAVNFSFFHTVCVSFHLKNISWNH